MPSNIDRDGRGVVRLDLPSNSHKSKGTDKSNKTITKPPMKKVTTGNVTVRKPRFGSKALAVFGGATLAVVTEYVVNDILIPEAKNILSEVIRGGSDMILYGEQQAGRSRLRNNQGNSFISYNKGSQSNRRAPRDTKMLGRTVHNFDDILFDTKGDAEEALKMLRERINEYAETTVADLYELAGITGSFADHKYGWDDLSTARTARDRSGGYLILFPKTIPLV